jgi:arylsulfatase A-like enzyme
MFSPVMHLNSDMKNYLSIALVACSLFCPAFIRAACSSATQQPPNIIVIFADDLGYGDLSSYGHPVIRTRHLDQMAAEGIRLTSFYAASSICTPSRAALLTGRYPVRCGLPTVLGPDSRNGLAAAEITLAEALKARSYNTMCIGKWHLGHAKAEYMPTGQGFDHYFGLLYSNDMINPWVQTDVPMRLYRDLKPTGEYPVDQKTLTSRYTSEAIKFINNNKNNPFFLYLPYSMPHVPIYVDDDFRGRSAAGLYGDVIEKIDWSVGEILKTLKDNNLDENTLVVFTSDNGPWINMPPRMYGGGIIKPWHAGSSGPLRDAKSNSYEGGFRVPCIIRWPGQIPENQVTSKVATTMDLYTTILNVSGSSVPDDHVVDGQDIMPMLRGDTTFERSGDFYYFMKEELEAIRSGPWKLRIAPYQGPDLPANEALAPELYHLLTDPAERINRANEFPEKVKELTEAMRRFQIKGSRLRF